MAEAINEMERRLAESNPHAGPNAKTEDFNQQPPSVKPAGKRHRTSPAPRKTDEDTKTAAETPSQQAEETWPAAAPCGSAQMSSVDSADI